MSEKYFKDFNWIEEIPNAKSLSYCSTKKDASFSKKLKDEFIYILSRYEDRFRLLLHTNVDDDLHNMVIAMKKNSYVYPHKHDKSESYQIISGKMALIYFKDNGKIDNISILSCDDTIVARVDNDRFHASVALEDTIYNETRIGPFVSQTDSIYPSWCEKNDDKFMDSILDTINEG